MSEPISVLLERSYNCLRTLVQWCELFSRSIPLSGEGENTQVNSDLMAVVRDGILYVQMVNAIVSDGGGSYGHSAALYQDRVALIDSYTTAMFQVIKKWEEGKSLINSMQDPHSRRHLDHLTVNLAALLEKHVRESASAPLPPHAQATLTTMTQSFQANKYLVTHETQDFWSRNFGTKVHVELDIFFSALGRHIGCDVIGRDREALWITLDSSGTGIVSASLFQDFVNAFGTTKKSIRDIVGNFIESWRQAWFVGFMGRDTANSILLNQPPGTFLIRFSSTHPTDFAISYVAADRTVRNHLIKTVDGAGYFLGSHTYASLTELVAYNSSILVMPAPTKIGFTKYFHGFIGFKDTEVLLSNQPPGTYLMRFSQTEPGWVVIAWVDNYGKVSQHRIPPDSASGGYRLGDQVFKTLDDIVNSFTSKFLYPYNASASTASFNTAFSTARDTIAGAAMAAGSGGGHKYKNLVDPSGDYSNLGASFGPKPPVVREPPLTSSLLPPSLLPAPAPAPGLPLPQSVGDKRPATGPPDDGYACSNALGAKGEKGRVMVNEGGGKEGKSMLGGKLTPPPSAAPSLPAGYSSSISTRDSAADDEEEDGNFSAPRAEAFKPIGGTGGGATFSIPRPAVAASRGDAPFTHNCSICRNSGIDHYRNPCGHNCCSTCNNLEDGPS